MSTVLLDTALKGTMLFAAAFALALLLRRASASAQHLLWVLTVVGLLALPVLGLILPRWQLPLASPWARAQPRPPRSLPLPLPWMGPQKGPEARAAASTRPGRDAEIPGVKLPIPHARPGLEAPNPPPGKPVLVASREHNLPQEARTGEPQMPRIKMVALPSIPARESTWPLLLWSVGVLVSLSWIAAGFVSLWLLRRHCRVVKEGPLVALLGEVVQTLGIRRRVQLLLSDTRAIPMTWGILRPVVMLPADAESWSAERLRLVLLHELGHVSRWDCLTQMLGHLARALYWFHPLAWLAVARLKTEQELACDDLVLRAGAGAADYAEHLLAVTAGLPADFFAPPVALAMGRAARLQRRLTALLEPRRERGLVHCRGLVLAVLLALAIVLPLAAVSWKTAGAAAAVPTPWPVDEPGGKKAREGAADPSKAFAEIRAKLVKHYVKSVDDNHLTNEAIKGMLQALHDPFTEYLGAEELARMESQLKAVLTGIGAQLGMNDGHLMVMTPLEGSPALKAGLRPGDEIEAIDGKLAADMDLRTAVRRILGPPGQVVKLKVVHPDGVVEELAITRAKVRFRTVEGFRRDEGGRWKFLLNNPHKVGYVRIDQFSHGTAAEVREAIEGLKKEGMKGLILDLRFCPGGLLGEAVNASRLFLKKGLIVTTRGPRTDEKKFEADGKDYLGDFPLVVLLNEHSASAAEIVAGALRDHGRAVLVGTRTYGKGSVSAILKLDAGGALKLTTAYHYLPSGRNIQKRPGAKVWGVDPTAGDYLPLTTEQAEALHKDVVQRRLVGMKKGEGPKWTEPVTPAVLEKEHADPQLAAALRTMVARLTGGQFIKVGRQGVATPEATSRLEELRGRREELLRDLRRLEKDIEEVQKGSGKRPKRLPE